MSLQENRRGGCAQERDERVISKLSQDIRISDRGIEQAVHGNGIPVDEFGHPLPVSAANRRMCPYCF